MRTGRAAVSVALALVLRAGAPYSVTAVAATSTCVARYPSDARLPWGCRVLTPGENVELLFGSRWVDVPRFNRIDRRHDARRLYEWAVGAGADVPLIRTIAGPRLRIVGDASATRPAGR